MRTERQTKGGDRSVTFLQYSPSCSKSQTNALSIFYLVRENYPLLLDSRVPHQ